MDPQELTEIQNRVHTLDEEYWNGSDVTFTDALNDLADYVGRVRDQYMGNGVRS